VIAAAEHAAMALGDEDVGWINAWARARQSINVNRLSVAVSDRLRIEYVGVIASELGDAFLRWTGDTPSQRLSHSSARRLRLLGAASKGDRGDGGNKD
jgi:hypothetical protein